MSPSRKRGVCEPGRADGGDARIGAVRPPRLRGDGSQVDLFTALTYNAKSLGGSPRLSRGSSLGLAAWTRPL